MSHVHPSTSQGSSVATKSGPAQSSGSCSRDGHSTSAARVIDLSSDDEIVGDPNPSRLKQSTLPFKPLAPPRPPAVHKTLSSPELIGPLRDLPLFASVPADSLLLHLLDVALSSLSPSSPTMVQIKTAISSDAFARRYNKPAKRLQRALMGPPAKEVPAESSSGRVDGGPKPARADSSVPASGRAGAEAGPSRQSSGSTSSVVPRAGKERQPIADLDSDSDLEILEVTEGPVRSSTHDNNTSHTSTDNNPCRPKKEILRSPAIPSPRKRPRLSSSSVSPPTADSVPQVSPSSIASPPRPSPFSSSSRPATLSTSLGPNNSPQRRSSTRVSKPIAEPNLRKTKFGPKTADGRRVILGRPNDDDNGQPERCAWCHNAQDDDWVGRKLCIDGEDPEAAPDAMACKPCKKLYDGERRGGRPHLDALSTLVEAMQASRAEHERKRDAA